jgi:hypothetical protein
MARGTTSISGSTPASPPLWGGGKTMAKMSIRKAGTIRLTSVAYYCCAA